MAKIDIVKLSELSLKLEKENNELVNIIKDIEKSIYNLDESIYNSPENNVVKPQLIPIFKQVDAEIPLYITESTNKLNLLIQKGDEINNDLNYTNPNIL